MASAAAQPSESEPDMLAFPSQNIVEESGTIPETVLPVSEHPESENIESTESPLLPVAPIGPRPSAGNEQPVGDDIRSIHPDRAEDSESDAESDDEESLATVVYDSQGDDGNVGSLFESDSGSEVY